MSSVKEYHNFLQDRKDEFSNVLFMSKAVRAKKSFYQKKSLSPADHKVEVLKSKKIQELIKTVSKQENIAKEKLLEQVQEILNEIGYNKNWKVIRSLGLLLTKICLKTCSGLYLNVAGVKLLRSKMGNCPVIFVPTHRSYADFIQLSYVCFTYDLAIPAIAAGMDFYQMWGMGTLLRDTGAFFMRRSYNNDSLYWTTFKQYIYQLVTNGELPLEFFIEGTRSRSGKSLAPKYGLLSMILKAFFLSQVPDIMFVPISICYDRVLEENLFTFEHLGVPKPKESTSGFLKSMKILKEKFGDTYVHFAPPLSAKEIFADKMDRSAHNLAPLHQQELTNQEKSLLPIMGHSILKSQQKHSVITVFNLIAMILNDNLSRENTALTLGELHERLIFLKNSLEVMGAYIPYKNQEDVLKALSVHSNLVQVVKDKVNIIFNSVVLGDIKTSHLKGHALTDKTMSRSVPLVMLQIYANPAIHLYIDLCFVVTILRVNPELTKDVLFRRFSFLKKIFSLEFVSYEPWINEEFVNALELGTKLKSITRTNGLYSIGNNNLLNNILWSNIEAYFLSYYSILTILKDFSNLLDEKSIYVKAQQALEIQINNMNTTFIHPYSLSLDSLNNCLNSLSLQKIIIKTRRDNKIYYDANTIVIQEISQQFDLYITKLQLVIECHQILNKL
ncbi:unnamed protein product [Brassicogethes aeneus]|uniref:Phospholipid/glycerol acyltransferase domain-containing protein n=1 Tax=Brassicogethes aeneus TaxID=1431903 RepID=A0A9P0FFM8_BRAAE|nr:unnamed protein product [Brassicogethes aeneus]